MIAAIDVGLKRIGIALCLDGDIVVPQNAILRKNRNQAAKEVDSMLAAWKINTLVVGIPKGGSAEAEMTRRIEHFVSLLTFTGEVVYHDESGSSMEAKEMMKGKVKQKRDGKVDSIAAQLILQRWLER